MSERRVGIIVSGATGRMGARYHLPALMAIRAEGGLPLANGDRLMPDPMLLGRNAERLAAVARELGIERTTTSLAEALAAPGYEVFFDAAATAGRSALLLEALRAGKHIFTEKPAVARAEEGQALIEEAEARGLKHGVVEDKLHLPGIVKLRHLREIGYFGRIVKFNLEFGNWVFDGRQVRCQRSSWNYRKAGEGGIMLDMFPHWRYVVEATVGRITDLCSVAWTATPERIDEAGRPYAVDVEDSGLCLVEIEGGARGSISSSWATRVHRDDLFSLQVDGTEGSAVANYHSCVAQPAALTPVAASSIGGETGSDHRAAWLEVPTTVPPRGSYRACWEAFLHHLADGTPQQADLRQGIRDVMFGELNRKSSFQRGWVSFPPQD